MPFVSFIVTDLDESCRLDVYTAKTQSQLLTRSQLKNEVTVININDRPSKLSSKIKNGDKVYLEWKDSIPSEIIPENIPLDILYEDEDVTVINKKQGMVTHPANGNWSGTLVNALLFHWNKQSISCKQGENGEHVLSIHARRPGIVHRLDKDTSGVILTAKNRKTEVYCQEQFKSRHVRKEYIAIVRGLPPNDQGEIKTQIVRDPKNRKLFITTNDISKGKFSHTLYTCIAVYGNYSLMRLRLKTGRTHQIRVHLKSIGCPILGDPLYSNKDAEFKTATLMLHSRKLKIKLPNKKYIEFVAPVPIRFKKVLRRLHELYNRTSIYQKKYGKK